MIRGDWAIPLSSSKPKSSDPAIDDVLASIREAIQEETARGDELRSRLADKAGRQPQLAPASSAGSRTGPVSGSMRELRVSLQPPQQSGGSGSVSTRSEDFLSFKNKIASLRAPGDSAADGTTGTVPSDPRLDDAVSRMNAAGLRQQAAGHEPAPAVPPRMAPPPVPPQPEFRASVHEPAPQDMRIDNPPRPEPSPPAPPVAQAVLQSQSPTSQATAGPPEATAQSLVQTPAPILSNDTSAAAAAAFDMLAEELFKRVDGGKTVLDDGVRDMLRPLLKKWLDDNLPSLVERLVREEIERVARRGGR